MLNILKLFRPWSRFLTLVNGTSEPVVCLPVVQAGNKLLAPYKHDPVAFAIDKLGFQPDEKQKLVLGADQKRIVLCASRQWGKSTVTAAKALHHAWFHPDSLVLVLSPSERQSAEFIRKVKAFLHKLNVKTKGDGDNDCSIVLPNRTRIVGLPGTESTNRGFSAPSLVLIDEASRVDDELYFAIRPMLATSNGQLIIMSTPKGRRGFFWEEWSSKENTEWLKIQVKANECPRISKQFLVEETLRFSAEFFNQEYMCEFTQSAGALFTEQQIQACFDPNIQPLRPEGLR